ncbi:ACT domain-containing protein [Streptomyces sp. NPDC041068]|uniref:ACT domain-containing protein n=1 Tax=Streptomyces sp. NPDC041068 TaxID=3155130 RepID=UPI0033FBEB2D
MTASRPQLLVLQGQFLVERADLPQAIADNSWLALVRAPEGPTVIRRARPGESDGTWAALYSGADPHGLDVPGVLVALLTPLAAADVPVFVASTYDADVVLVPYARLDDAVTALNGHCDVRREEK